MTIETKSAFLYGLTVDEQNYFLNFDEGSGELSAEVAIGDYTPETLANAVASAMSSAGSQEYSCTYNRSTRLLTIFADDPFTLLCETGSAFALSIFSLLGFDTDDDLTGFATYTAQNQSGKVYYPQIPLQKYTPFSHWLVPSSAKANVSASGEKVEVISFGEQRFMEFDLMYITDKNLSGSPIEYNSSGVADYLEFIEYAVTKSILQFIPDRDNFAVYDDCILESTPQSREGTAYKLEEMYSRKITGYYETGTLKFRKIL